MEKETIKSEIGSIQNLFAIFGILVGATSLFGFFQHIFDFGILSIFGDILSFYRQASYILLGWIPHFLDWDAPAYVHDLWPLSFAGAGAFMRGVDQRGTKIRSSDSGIRDRRRPTFLLHLHTTLSIIVLGILFIGLIPLLIGLWRLLFVRRKKNGYRRWNFGIAGLGGAADTRVISIQVCILLVVAFIFFVLNAYGVSIT